MKRRLTARKKTTFLGQNTFIGGVASVITNTTELASYLSIADVNISNFVISGDDISCYINADYTINSNAFNNDGSIEDWGNGDIVTYYTDLDFKCTSEGINAFKGQNYLSFCYFGFTTSPGVATYQDVGANTQNGFLLLTPLLEDITNGSEFLRGSDFTTFVAPKLTSLGSTAGDNFVFLLADNTDVYVNNVLETADSGNPDGDLVYLAGRFNTNIYYSDNLTAPNAISDLSVDFAYTQGLDITWSAPTSTNTISKYCVIMNNKFIGSTTDTFFEITDLTISTIYSIQVITLDEHGNHSFSNVLSASTSATFAVNLANISNYYNVDANSEDQIGSNDGVDTSISYVAGGMVSNKADFTASTLSKITIPHNSDLDYLGVDWTISFGFELATSQDTMIAHKRNSFSSRELFLYYFSGDLFVQIFDEINDGWIRKSHPITLLEDTFYHVSFGLKGDEMLLYLNGLPVGTDSSSGVFTSIRNEGADLVLGINDISNTAGLDGYMDEIVLYSRGINKAVAYDLYQKINSGTAVNA